jgi:hypothetical protein
MTRYIFTIRDVLWLTVVVAFALGWLVDRSVLSHKMAGIVRLYESAAARLNATSKPTDAEILIISR